MNGGGGGGAGARVGYSLFDEGGAWLWGFSGFCYIPGLSYSPYVFPAVASGDFSSVIFREHS